MNKPHHYQPNIIQTVSFCLSVNIERAEGLQVAQHRKKTAERLSRHGDGGKNCPRSDLKEEIGHQEQNQV